MESKKSQHNTNTSELAMEASGAAAGGAGVLALWASIRRNFAANMTKLGEYAHLKDARKNTEKGLKGGLGDLSGFEDVKGVKELKGFKGLDGLKGKEFIEANYNINRAYSRSMDKVHANRGITNSFQKFEMLTRNQKMTVIGAAIAVTSVGIGAILNIHHKRQIAEELKAINSRNTSDTAALPAL